MRYTIGLWKIQGLLSWFQNIIALAVCSRHVLDCKICMHNVYALYLTLRLDSLSPFRILLAKCRVSFTTQGKQCTTAAGAAIIALNFSSFLGWKIGTSEPPVDMLPVKKSTYNDRLLLSFLVKQACDFFTPKN